MVPGTCLLGRSAGVLRDTTCAHLGLMSSPPLCECARDCSPGVMLTASITGTAEQSKHSTQVRLNQGK